MDGRWEEVAAAVRRRRGELGIQQNELAELAAVDVSTLRNIEHVRRTSYDPVTLAKVSRALGWETDGIDRVLAGEEPRERPEPVPADTGVTETARLLGALEERVRAIERRLDRLDRIVDRVLDQPPDRER
ncbi:MAG: helix-turn-helix domain-containing protein [Nitriliruptorales bacterium]